MSLLVLQFFSRFPSSLSQFQPTFCFVCRLSFFCVAVSRPCRFSVFNLHAAVLS